MSLPAPSLDTTVLVTGASSGIGTELARQLAALGHDLVLVARREDRLEALADEVRRQHGVTALVKPTDLSKAAPRKRLIDAVRDSGRTVVGLCNDAGFGTYGRLHELDPRRETEMLAVNAVAVHELTMAFVPAMVERGEGAILNVASIAAFQPLPNMATYAATKAFVQSFSEALHGELTGTGVSCTTLAPGPSPTEFGRVSGSNGNESVLPGVSLAPEEIAAAAIRGMLRGRRSVIPGAASKALAAGGRFAPRSVLLPAALRAADGRAAERATRPPAARPLRGLSRRRPRPATGG
ncbi:MAG TPA: SDR family oxidoreductase [Solirubrobacteraceae bacterium]